MATISELISNEVNEEPDLPLVHTTDAFRFEKVLRDKILKRTMCPHFGENLLYLFYGRPAYRTRKQQVNENLSFDLPVVVLLKNSAKVPYHRVHPFDTGAFKKGKYSSYFHEDMTVDEFEITPDIQTIKKYLSFFYRNNSEYYFGSTRKNVDIKFNDFAASGLHELAKTPASPLGASNRPPDERSSSIEIQVSDDLALSDNVLAIILPQLYLDDLDLATSVYGMGAKHVLPYPSMTRMGSEFLAGHIYGMIEKIYLDEGYIQK